MFYSSTQLFFEFYDAYVTDYRGIWKKTNKEQILIFQLIKYFIYLEYTKEKSQKNTLFHELNIGFLYGNVNTIL